MKRALALLLCQLLCVSLAGCGVFVRGVNTAYDSMIGSSYQGRHGKLTPEEEQWAKIAWKYFENNYNIDTGLVNSVDRFPSTSAWNIGDYLAALISAKELGLVDDKEFGDKLSKLLKFLNTMSLFEGGVPNKLYHTGHGGMVDYNNERGEIGWSAADIGRLLVWLGITGERYPIYREYIEKAVLRWKFCRVINDCGMTFGAIKTDKNLKLYQEGRMGNEEYSALGFQLWGFNTHLISSEEHHEKAKIYGVEITYDGRDPSTIGNYAPVSSLPNILSGMEFNWLSPVKNFLNTVDTPGAQTPTVLEANSKSTARAIYQVQELRFRNEKIFTARAEAQVSVAPHFLYNSIFVDGYPWAVISDNGKSYPQLALVSTRAAFGLWALWNTDYTDQLIGVVSKLYNPDRGWFEGRYELTGGYEETITSSTNSTVLEALLYKLRGPLLTKPLQDGYLAIRLNNEFTRPGHCFPQERETCQTH